MGVAVAMDMHASRTLKPCYNLKYSFHILRHQQSTARWINNKIHCWPNEEGMGRPTYYAKVLQTVTNTDSSTKYHSNQTNGWLSIGYMLLKPLKPKAILVHQIQNVTLTTAILPYVPKLFKAYTKNVPWSTPNYLCKQVLDEDESTTSTKIHLSKMRW